MDQQLNYIESLPLGGFNFDNCIRNKAMEVSGIAQPPKTMKTGTTICGVIFKVSDLNLHKIFFYIENWNLIAHEF